MWIFSLTFFEISAIVVSGKLFLRYWLFARCQPVPALLTGPEKDSFHGNDVYLISTECIRPLERLTSETNLFVGEIAARIEA